MEENSTLNNVWRHNYIKNKFNEQKKQEIQRTWYEKTSSLNMDQYIMAAGEKPK